MKEIIIALIAAIPPTFVAFLSLVNTKKNSNAIQNVHLSINSKMDDLLKATKGESFAEGREQGRSENK